MRRVAIVIAILAFVVYAATAAPGLTWAHDGADGGDLAAAVAAGGVPHPPGYPTYMLLGRILAAALPLGDIAFRLNLLSALCAALAVGLVLAVGVETTHGSRWAWPACAAAALGFAFSPVFWSQAVITEVYALNALFVALLLYLAQAGRGRGGAALTGLVFGLALGNHLTIILLLPTLAVLLLGAEEDGHEKRSRALAATAAALLGLAVYAYVPLAARSQPLVSWGGADTAAGLRWLVTGGPYSSYAFHLPLVELPGRLAAWARLLLVQLGWIGVLPALAGLWDMLGAGEHEPAGGPRQGWALLVGFVLYSVYALGYRTADSYLYLIPAFLIAALWLGRGLSLIVEALPAAVQEATRWRRLLLIAGMLLWLPVWQFTANWSSMNLSSDDQAMRYSSAVLQQLPTGALVVTASDEHTFALWYGQVVTGRPDLLIVDRDLTQFAWYRRQIAARLPSAAPPVTAGDEPAQYVAQLIGRAGRDRPIFLADADADLIQRFSWLDQGLLRRLAGP